MMKKFVCCLIGPYGAGKTTAGRMLADFLSIKFFDLDAEVEHVTGKSIINLLTLPEQNLGALGKIEHKVLSDLIDQNNTVLAISVNSISRADNRLLLRNKQQPGSSDVAKQEVNKASCTNTKKRSRSKECKIIYLAATPIRQYIRSMLSSRPQPILANFPNKLQYLTESFAEMDPIYRSIADFVVQTDNYLIEEVVNKIIDYLYCSAYS